MPKLLTPEEVRTFFKLARVKTVYEWIDQGYIRVVYKIKGSYRIPEAEISRILEENKQEK